MLQQSTAIFVYSGGGPPYSKMAIACGLSLSLHTLGPLYKDVSTRLGDCVCMMPLSSSFFFFSTSFFFSPEQKVLRVLLLQQQQTP
jgi:hypothetical protein